MWLFVGLWLLGFCGLKYIISFPNDAQVAGQKA